MISRSAEVVVIGGGFYGLRIALFLREQAGVREVIVLEAAGAPMERASYVNQARVHNGYHYPRSILTAYRSQVNFPRFAEEYPDAVIGDFRHYYGIARTLSKTNARQFQLFCRRIGSAVKEAPRDVVRAFDPNRVEEVFEVVEPAFDSRILRAGLMRRIDAMGGIDIRTGVTALRVGEAPTGVQVTASDGRYVADRVISAVYAGINTLHAASGLPLVDLQHEVTELALVDLPPTLRGSAVTVMDGPFFSMMPFPSRGLHSLSHVRYTPHHRWREGGEVGAATDPYAAVQRRAGRSHFASMYADVVRYLPGAAGMQHRDSLYEAKTVLTRSASDDSRPILFRPDRGLTGYTAILGAKLDNIYDVLTELEQAYATR